MSEYGRFSVGGHEFVAELPDLPPDVWTVTVTHGRETEIHHIPMSHPPIFGPDVDDVMRLNSWVESFIADRGLE